MIPAQPDVPRSPKPPLTVIPMVLALLMFWFPPAFAHKVSVFAWVEGDMIHTQSKFSGGRKVKGGEIEVYDPQGKILLQGRTDDQGKFSFPVPRTKHDLKIVLIAGSGHGNQWIVRSEELNPALSQVETAKEHPPQAPQASQAPLPSQGAAGPCPDAAAMQRMLDLALQKHLAPLKAQLAERGWGLRDIISGIGYILGLMGLAGYLHYRKKGKSPDYDR